MAVDRNRAYRPPTGHKTQAGMVLGTAAYMSPEQVRAHPVDHRSDIFSFGLVLYEMLSGQQAFKADSAVETMSAILKADPPRLTETRRDLPPDLDRIILHCLEKNPEERFQSAGDIAFNLESIGQSSSTSGKAIAHPATARSRWMVPALAAAAVAAGAGLFSAGRATAPPRPSRNSTSSPSAEDRSRRRASRLTDARSSTPPAGKARRRRSTRRRRVTRNHVRWMCRRICWRCPARVNWRSCSRVGQTDGRAGTDAARRWRAARVAGRRPRCTDGARTATSSPSSTSMDGRQRLEYPIGRVLYEPPGWISSISVSPSGDRIAFAEHPITRRQPRRHLRRRCIRQEDDAGGRMGGSRTDGVVTGRTRDLVLRVHARESIIRCSR